VTGTVTGEGGLKRSEFLLEECSWPTHILLCGSAGALDELLKYQDRFSK
jgi:hypothetical protein